MNPKSLLLIGGGALLLAALLLPGQDGRREWTLSRNNGSTVRFQIERWKPDSHTSTSTDVPFDRFRGLSPTPSAAAAPSSSTTCRTPAASSAKAASPSAAAPANSPSRPTPISSPP